MTERFDVDGAVKRYRQALVEWKRAEEHCQESRRQYMAANGDLQEKWTRLADAADAMFRTASDGLGTGSNENLPPFDPTQVLVGRLLKEKGE